ncbi:transposase family protein [Streptomyces sp. NPDC056291]|uniref:helix-turn-helix domain-containing protein n=1 Tax=Streptomyces sp. NPDC056291 TaxID=3345772 RepID=UPI0035E27DAA
MTKEWARAALSHPAFTGISRAHLGGLIEEPAGPWTARCESARHERRGGNRRQLPGAGPKHDRVFTDRVLVTLVHLRHQPPHAALAELYGLEGSTITRAIGEIRPLLAARGFAVPDRPGLRLHTLADAVPQSKGSRSASTAPRPRSAAPGPTRPKPRRWIEAQPSRRARRPWVRGCPGR